MIKPTIHLNGTSPERLRDGYEKATRAVNEAYASVLEAAPNARDYYPQGPDAFARADAEHVSRLKRLDDVQKELADLWAHASEAVDVREERRRSR